MKEVCSVNNQIFMSNKKINSPLNVVADRFAWSIFATKHRYGAYNKRAGNCTHVITEYFIIRSLGFGIFLVLNT